jgi:hypothetical protein
MRRARCPGKSAADLRRYWPERRTTGTGIPTCRPLPKRLSAPFSSEAARSAELPSIPAGQRVDGWARQGFEPVTSSVSAKPGNRCARSRSPRSPATVDPEGKRSLDVKGNALFATSCRWSQASTSRGLAALMHRQRGRDVSLTEQISIGHDRLTTPRQGDSATVRRGAWR